MELFLTGLVVVCILMFIAVLFKGGGEEREATVLEENRRPEKRSSAPGWTQNDDVLYSHRTSGGRTIKIERYGHGCVVASDAPQSGRGGTFTVTTPEGDAYEWREPESL